MTGPSPPSRARLWDLPEKEALENLAERLSHAARKRIDGILFRAVLLRHIEKAKARGARPLHYLGSLAGACYTPRGGPAGLYLTFDPSTAPAEVRAVVFAGGRIVRTAEHDPIVTISVRARVQHVLDLTDHDTRQLFELSASDLFSDWESEQAYYLDGRGSMPITQRLAEAAHTTALITAIKYPSARTDFGLNLVVFPDRLDREAGDMLEVVDGSGYLTQRLPG